MINGAIKPGQQIIQPETLNMTNENELKTLYWVLQDNQVTPFITDFLSLIAEVRTKPFCNIKFMVPAVAPEALKLTKALKPVPFQVSTAARPSFYEGYMRKRDLLKHRGFSEGLEFYKALLLDDMGGGDLYQTRLHLRPENPIQAIIIQIPTPLGSSDIEERVFYAWVHWAKMLKIPIIGYELLPLDTRWTLAPSLMDGIITRKQESYEHLTQTFPHMKGRIWLLPRYEASFFSPASTPLWRNGMGVAYKYQNNLPLSHEKTVLYIPHNVAMTYDYKKLLEYIAPMGQDLHLMFSVGKDQVRGSHTHQQNIEIVSHKELKHFSSYSFHDINVPSEITMADAVVACASCYGTILSSENNIPTIIFDEMVPAFETGWQKKVASKEELIESVQAIINAHGQRLELSRILLQLVNRRSNV